VCCTRRRALGGRPVVPVGAKSGQAPEGNSGCAVSATSSPDAQTGSTREHARAERLAREAISIAERTDSLNWQADAYCDLTEVLIAADRTNEAAEALDQALDRYQRKKNLAMVIQVRPKLEALRQKLPT